jgi:hypothetical protein
MGPTHAVIPFSRANRPLGSFPVWEKSRFFCPFGRQGQAPPLLQDKRKGGRFRAPLSVSKKSFRPAERDFFEQRTFKKVVD